MASCRHLLLLSAVCVSSFNPTTRLQILEARSLAAFARSERFAVEPAGEEDLEAAADLCVDIFFGRPGMNPFRSSNLARLQNEQLADLEGKYEAGGTTFFKVAEGGTLVGFAELTISRTMKYLGGGIPDADARPVLANLAVSEDFRRRGVGSVLVRACEAEAWGQGYREVVLQVEEDNERARTFYAARGYDDVYCDRAARRYDASGLFLSNVRTSRLTLRKVLSGDRLPPNQIGPGIAEAAKSLVGGLRAIFGRSEGQ